MHRITYLVSQYPAYNHTFILREIQALRRAGVDVSVMSIRDADRPGAAMTGEERAELAATWYVLRRGVAGCLGALARLLVRRPAAVARATALAFRLAAWNLASAVRNLLYLAEALIVADRLRTTAAGRVHVHFASTVALLAKELHDFEMSMTIHGPAEFDDAGFAMGRKVAASSRVVAISHFGRSQILRLSRLADWEKVRVVPLGVETAKYVLRAPRPAGAVRELLCVGRLAPVKGHGILLEALAALRERGIPVRLRLVGDGPDRQVLERYAARLAVEEFVRFEGPQNQDRVREFFGAADLFVLASFAEGVPVVLMEAMALGVPCVATRVNGVPELIRDAVDGILVNPGDARDLADAVQRLLDDPGLGGRMVASARERVCARYDLDRNGERLANVLFEDGPC